MNDIETQILELIGENITAPDVFVEGSDSMAMIRDSVSDAIEELCMVTGSYKRPYRLMCEAGQNFYRLRFTRDYLGWIAGAWVPSLRRRLVQWDAQRMVHENPRWLENSGSPRVYIPIGTDVVALWPAPGDESVYIDFTMVMIPSRYAEAEDRIKMKESFRWAAVYYAVSEYYASRGDAKQAQENLKRYLEAAGLQSLFPKAAEKPWKLKTKNVDR